MTLLFKSCPTDSTYIALAAHNGQHVLSFLHLSASNEHDKDGCGCNDEYCPLTMFSRRSGLCLALLLVLNLIPSVVQGKIPNSNPVSGAQSPYQVLGVGKNASNEEIRRSYRELCLKNHPDKNVHLPKKERDLAEERFKLVQTANSEIGNAEKRREFDKRQSLFGSSGGMPAYFSQQRQSGTASAQSQSFEEAFAQAFRQRQGMSSSGGRSSQFYGFSASDVFSRGSRTPGFSSPVLSGLNSVYVQKVAVSLQDLYAGAQGVEVTLKDTIWKRYSAAFRGGVAYLLLYQAFLYSIPSFRMSTWFAALFGSVVFHVQLPRPTMTQYTFDLKPGYKDGTRLRFKDMEPGFEVVFVLVQGEKHDTFTRVGNDLHVTVPISRQEMKEGCTIDIEPLGPGEATIEVEVAPGVIDKAGQTLTVKKKGWPIRKLKTHGDLIVHFTLTTIRRRQPKQRQEWTAGNTKSKTKKRWRPWWARK
jgi:DnaJ-class molecular chaperone